MGKTSKATTSVISANAEPKTRKKPSAAKPIVIPTPWMPFVFDNSIADGPENQRKDLLDRVTASLQQLQNGPHQFPSLSLLGYMLGNGIDISLRDPPGRSTSRMIRKGPG